MSRRRALAPPIVITLALAPGCTRTHTSNPPEPEVGGSTASQTKSASQTNSAEPPEPAAPRERSYTEFRNGTCTVVPDCTPPEGTNVNPCNPPPPRVDVECPPELLPTQPPETKITKQADGTCWVDCDEKTCDFAGPLRVRCPVPGEKALGYESALVVPKATKAKYDTGVFHRNADLGCDLVECEDGTKCANPPGRTITNVPCPPELIPKVAKGIVPVRSSKRFLCFFGRVPVACPEPFHVWH